MMKAAKRKSVRELSQTAQVLLGELREECENAAELIRRLEARPRSEQERDAILGELSAAVLHLHAHTQGLDEYLCEID